jgi:hypothetical protein
MLQFGNMIDNHWALGENMKKPYGIHLGTPNSQKIPSTPLSPKRKKLNFLGACCFTSLARKDLYF